ncbi:hypothetical protein IWQ60_003323 [Tieghemiomyces parasiticus]|uniref:Uncharacterized protein n=1 Tax=Tieghemiomyces parasiticus TaxID=78921 RepID=A0A9W8E0S9_9FUNG|nr:hypothetical protein IWQ60_003323 [Tieghemiomyces parasiticus]
MSLFNTATSHALGGTAGLETGDLFKYYLPLIAEFASTRHVPLPDTNGDSGDTSEHHRRPRVHHALTPEAAKVNEYTTVLSRLLVQCQRTFGVLQAMAASDPEQRQQLADQGPAAEFTTAPLVSRLFSILKVAAQLPAAIKPRGEVHVVCYRSILQALATLLMTIDSPPNAKTTKDPATAGLINPDIPTDRIALAALDALYRWLLLGCGFQLPALVASPPSLYSSSPSSGTLPIPNYDPTDDPEAPAPPSSPSSHSFILPIATGPTLDLFYFLGHYCLERLDSVPLSSESGLLATRIQYLLVGHILSSYPRLLTKMVPGILSTVSGLLRRPAVHTGPSKVVARLVATVRMLLTATLNNQTNAALIDQSEVTWKTLHARAKAGADGPIVKMKGTEPLDPTDSVELTDPVTRPVPRAELQSDSSSSASAKDLTWWRQTLANVQVRLDYVLALRSHAHWRVRRSVAALVDSLLSHCFLTFQSSLGGLLETAAELAIDPMAEVRARASSAISAVRTQVERDTSGRCGQVIREELTRVAGRAIPPLLTPQSDLVVPTLADTATASRSRTPGIAPTTVAGIPLVTVESGADYRAEVGVDVMTESYSARATAETVRYMRVMTAFSDILPDTSEVDTALVDGGDLLTTWLDKIMASLPLDTSGRPTAAPGGAVVQELSPATSSASNATSHQITDPYTVFRQRTDELMANAVVLDYRGARTYLQAVDEYLTRHLPVGQDEAPFLQRLIGATTLDSTPSSSTLLIDRQARSIYLTNRALHVLAARYAKATELPSVAVQSTLLRLLRNYHACSSATLEGEAAAAAIGTESTDMARPSSTNNLDPTTPSYRRQAVVNTLVLEGQALIARIFGPAFRPQLLHVLFPMLLQLATQATSSLVTHQARLSLDLVGVSCGYAGPAELVADNVDYLMHGFSQRLQLTVTPRPVWFRVLQEVIHLAGRLVIPFADDVLEDMLDGLATWSDRAEVTLAIWRVVAALAGALDEHFAPRTVRQLLSLGAETEQKSVGQRTVQLLGDRPEWVEAMEEGNVEEIKRPLPDWVAQLHALVSTPPSGTGSDHGVSPSTAASLAPEPLSEASEASPSPTASPPPEPEETNPALTVEQALAYKIALFTPNFLSAGAPQIRAATLDTLTHALAVVPNTREFLALINRVWPDVAAHLRDPSNNGDTTSATVLRATELVRVMSQLGGDFMRRRFVEEVWPAWSAWIPTVLRDCVQPRHIYPYLVTSDCQTALVAVLETLADVARFVPLPTLVAARIVTCTIPFLGARFHSTVQEAARRTLVTLAERHDDVVWIVLSETPDPYALDSGAAQRPQVAAANMTTTTSFRGWRQRPVLGWSKCLGPIEANRQAVLRAVQ